MRISVIVTDMPDGSVKIDADPVPSELMSMIKGDRLGASTSACMYALGMLTWAARRSRELQRGDSLLVLPPGLN